MNVEDAIEELRSQNGPCVKHRYDIMNLLDRQKREIEALKKHGVEAVQFNGDADSLDKIVKFVDSIEWVMEYRERGPRGMFSGQELEIIGDLWGGFMYEGEWLVKRNDKVVKLSDKEYRILFGEENE